MSQAQGTTIVCGLKRFGLRIARAVIELGGDVIVVASSPHPALLREAKKARARVVDVRSDEIAELESISMQKARCLVLTDDADLGNLQVGLAAREVNPDLRIAMRCQCRPNGPS